MMRQSAGDLRGVWVAKARHLDSRGHFADYPPKRREEVLRKGFLGAWTPDRAIVTARKQVELGIEWRTQKFMNEMRDHFGLVGEDIRLALLDILGEIPPESYEPPRELEEPSGCPFIFHCARLDCLIYLKIQIQGTMKKPRVLFWSCHPPVYSGKKEQR
jgi:hypothetical protein